MDRGIETFIQTGKHILRRFDGATVELTHRGGVFGLPCQGCCSDVAGTLVWLPLVSSLKSCLPKIPTPHWNPCSWDNLGGTTSSFHSEEISPSAKFFQPCGRSLSVSRPLFTLAPKRGELPFTLILKTSRTRNGVTPQSETPPL